MHSTPMRLFQEQAAVFLNLVPQLADGNVTAVHDARVATRRLRELLPLTLEWLGPARVEALSRRFARLGRRLGHVRDADVRAELLQHLMRRIPSAAASITALVEESSRARMNELRRLIKYLERQHIAEQLEATHALRAARWRLRPPSGWKRRLDHGVAARAGHAAQSVHHATGVYFPNRTHRTRIAVKKLRYVLEGADLTGRLNATEEVRLLRKVQGLLGDIHDRQELLDRLEAHTPEDQQPTGDTRALTQLLKAECHERHQRYLSLREPLLRACGRFAPVARAPVAPAAFAAALAASAGLIASTRLTQRRVTAPAPAHAQEA